MFRLPSTAESIMHYGRAIEDTTISHSEMTSYPIAIIPDFTAITATRCSTWTTNSWDVGIQSLISTEKLQLLVPTLNGTCKYRSFIPCLVIQSLRVSPLIEAISFFRDSNADSKFQGNVNCQSSPLYRIACASGDQRFSAKLSAFLV